MRMTENLADWGRALAKITEEAAVVILPFCAPSWPWSRRPTRARSPRPTAPASA
jgi:hypothetical protein